MRSRIICFFAASIALLAPLAQAEPVLIRGSATATAPFVAALSRFRAAGFEIKIDTESNTSRAVEAVGVGEASIAVATRPMTAAERAAYPERKMEEIAIGFQVIAFTVPVDVWNDGVRTITKEQAEGIYEGEITTWKQMGGASDRPIKFFNPEQGHGVWEIFAGWVYGDPRKAPLAGKFEKVSGGEETRNVIEFNAGSLSLLAPARIDRHGVFALSIKSENQVVAPKLSTVMNRSYPLARPLEVITGERPTGDVKRIIDFMTGTAGREFLLKTDFMPLTEE